jgi:hypothetical protein
MSVAETALDRPAAIGLTTNTEPRPRSLEAEHAVTPARRSSLDEDGGILGLTVGSGILFIQACAIIPGLLPFLLLLLPVVVLGAVGALLIGLPLGLIRLASWVGRRLS